MTIRNPLEWSLGQFWGVPRETARPGGTAWVRRPASLAPPRIARIGFQDLKAALRAGLRDFGACRTDVTVLCILYPVIGLVLAQLAIGHGVLPLLFPLASGFALVGPLFGVGLYEMSRRREMGQPVGWADAFAVLRAPGFGAIMLLGLILVGILLGWLVAAGLIYDMTLGPAPPVSVAQFAHDVLTTPAGWVMIVVGFDVGFLFAAVALAVGAVSFPLLLDREIGLDAAVALSIRAVRENPGTMALWGLIVAAGLAVGSIPAFLGLTAVLPVLGHATWHLYRRVVVP